MARTRTVPQESVGVRFGCMTVLRILNTMTANGSVAHCRCDCGLEKDILVKVVRKGTSRCSHVPKLKPVKAAKIRPIPLSSYPEYSIWSSMTNRCRKHKNYHGRGIAVCERWHKFENFILDMGRRPSPKRTIERKNNDGPYSPDNCVWATQQTQMNNTRVSRLVTFSGVTMTVSQWARSVGMSYRTLYLRIYKGWPVDLAINYPTRKPRRLAQI